jgi:hypothetical protein
VALVTHNDDFFFHLRVFDLIIFLYIGALIGLQITNQPSEKEKTQISSSPLWESV